MNLQLQRLLLQLILSCAKLSNGPSVERTLRDLHHFLLSERCELFLAHSLTLRLFSFLDLLERRLPGSLISVTMYHAVRDLLFDG